MKRARMVLFCAITLLVSCAGVPMVMRSARAMPPSAEQLEGRSIGIIPLTVVFGSPRVVSEMRGASVAVISRTLRLQDRFLAMDTDVQLGEVGVLDVDVFSKTLTDAAAVRQLATKLFEAGLRGALDYHLGFFKGFGEDSMGELSNVPIDYDRTVYPPQVVYKRADEPPPFYEDVRVLDAGAGAAAAGTSLLLSGELAITSEVVEILSESLGARTQSQVHPSARAPRRGDYYLVAQGKVRFTLVDARTGAVIATEKSHRDWPVVEGITERILIPVGKGDADGYARYFQSQDFTQVAAGVAQDLLPTVMPLVAPYFVNTTHQAARQ